MRTLIILICLFSYFPMHSQTTKPKAERTKEIRSLYKEIITKKTNYEKYIIQMPYSGGVEFNDTLYYSLNELKLLVISDAGEFSGSTSDIYFHKGKIFFIYTRTCSEGHWMQKPTPFTAHQYRYYFDENEQLIKALMKEVKGTDFGPNLKNVYEQFDNTKNIEIKSTSPVDFSFKQVLNTGRKYKQILTTLLEIH